MTNATPCKALLRLRPGLWAARLIFSVSLVLPSTRALSQNELPPGAQNIDKSPESFPEGLVNLSSRREFASNFFVVDMSRRLLRVYRNENGMPKQIAEVPSDLGKRAGRKMRENDHRTPIGIYFLQEKKSPPEIPFDLYGQLAFTTDYPNVFDKRDHRTGHGIWLHAVPDQVPLTRGSRGCVVVRNDVIKDLAPHIQLNQTPIVIFENLAEIPKSEYLKSREQFTNFVETWRKAWQEQDIETYIKFYDPTFYNAEMNFDQWYRHKKRLKGNYKFIRVNLSEPVIIRNRDQVVIRLLQEYQSDLHSDFGEKTIHAHYSPETGFKIVREDWKPMTMPADWIPTPATRGLSSTGPALPAPASDL